MTRLDYNLLIIKEIEEYAKANPDQRFNQILYNLRLATDHMVHLVDGKTDKWIGDDFVERVPYNQESKASYENIIAWRENNE